MIKKNLLLTLMLSVAASAFAVEVEIGGLWYDIINKAGVAKVIQYKNNNKYSGNIDIPATIEYNETSYPVTSIGNFAFSGCTSLTSINIPNSVTSIGEFSFGNCSGLTNIAIPSSVTSIGMGAFSECNGLTSVDISNLESWCNLSFSDPETNPLYYAHHLFLNGEEIKYLVIPNNVTNIGDFSFECLTNLVSVNIPNSVTSIGEYSFGECSGLNSVIIPSSVTSLGVGAFCDCSGLTSIVIPNSVTSIENAFGGCTSLISVTIPNSVTSIADAFRGCTSLTSVTIPNSVTNMDYAFYGCTSLTSIAIPNSVTSIDHTFYGCTSLTSVTIPNSVTSIDHTFYGCTSLTSITIPNNVTTIEQYSFADCSSLTSVAISNSVTSIKSFAFQGCSALPSITIPSNVTYIGGFVFNNCSLLTSVVISNSVSSIKEYAFSNCGSLTSVTIPNSVTTIGEGAFSNCSKLATITIGNGISSISSHAFSNCPNLVDVCCFAENVPSTSSFVFENSYIEYATLHLPVGSVDAYQEEEPWCCFGTILPIGNYYSLTLTASKGGSIGDGTNQISNGMGSYYVEEGNEVELSFTPDEGYILQSVSVNGVSVGTASSYTISSMTADVTVNATFVRSSDHTTVTIGSTGMATYCPMDDVDFSTVNGLKAYTATGYDHGTLTVSRVLNAPAGTGLLLQGEAGSFDVPYATSTGYYINLLHGLMTDTQVLPTKGGYTNFILGQKSGVTTFYRLSEAGTVAAGKAYLQLPTSVVDDGSSSRVMRIVAEDETTGVRSVELLTNSEGVNSEELFDLQGRRVAKPSKGIYIVGGQKVVVK